MPRYVYIIVQLFVVHKEETTQHDELLLHYFQCTDKMQQMHSYQLIHWHSTDSACSTVCSILQHQVQVHHLCFVTFVCLQVFFCLFLSVDCRMSVAFVLLVHYYQRCTLCVKMPFCTDQIEKSLLNDLCMFFVCYCANTINNDSIPTPECSIVQLLLFICIANVLHRITHIFLVLVKAAKLANTCATGINGTVFHCDDVIASFALAFFCYSLLRPNSFSNSHYLLPAQISSIR